MAVVGPMLAKQSAVDLLVVIALCVFVGCIADRSALGVARATALAGFAMITVQELANSIWYGFTWAWSIVNVADQTISFFLTGLVIGALMMRLDRDRGVAIPDGQGYRTSGGRKTVAS